MKKTLPILLVLLIMLTSVAAQGTLKWVHSVGTVSSDLRGCPAIAPDGTIYLGSKNEKLSAINPDGTLKWEYKTLGTSWHSPTIGADGTIYIGSNISKTNYNAGLNKNFYAINPDGTLKWAVKAGLLIESSVAIAEDGTLYLNSSDGLAAYNTDGTLIWNYALISTTTSTPAVSSDGTIYIDGFSSFYAFNPDGSIKWSKVMESNSTSSPAIGSDGTVYIGSKDKTFYALNPINGEEKWAFNAGSMVLAAPVIDANGVIYFGTYAGKFYALNPDGTEKWFYQFSEMLGFGENDVAAIGDNGVIYLGASDPEFWFYRRVYALNNDGTLKWEFQTEFAINTPVTLASDGTVYIGSTEGTLFALEGESTGVANSPWPKFRGNTSNTALANDSLENTTILVSLKEQNIKVKCYPNPFENSTTIDFNIDKTENLSIKIFSITGNEIATLYQGKKQAGKHSVIFDASSISGYSAQQVYICKIQTKNQIQTSLLFQNR